MKIQTKTYNIPGAAIALLASAATLATPLLAGCSTPIRQIVEAEPSTLGPVPADRDDVPRALLVALEAAEAALLDGSWAGDTYTATFLIVENREGVASATHHADGTATLRAFIEPRGDLAAQRTLLDAWARRLGQLEGVEWAPR
jgi:hypothetical protein